MGAIVNRICEIFSANAVLRCDRDRDIFVSLRSTARGLGRFALLMPFVSLKRWERIEILPRAFSCNLSVETSKSPWCDRVAQ